MLAIEVEHRLRLKRENRKTMFNVATNDNSFDETLHNSVASNYDTSVAIDSLFDDNAQPNQSDTTTLVQHNKNGLHSSSSDVSHASDGDNSSKSSKDVPLTLNIHSEFETITPRNQSPSFSLHSSPSVDALNESRNLSLYFTPLSGRESFSPIPAHKTTEFTPSRLIRSNSYTLDKPSPMLLKHMANNFMMNSTLNVVSAKSPMSPFQNNQTNTSRSIPRKSKLSGNENENTSNHKSRCSMVKAPIGSARSTASSSSKYESLSNGSTKSSTTKSTKPVNKSHLSTSIFKNNETILRSIYGQKPNAKVEHSAKRNTSARISSDSSNQNTGKSPQMLNSNAISSTNTSSHSNSKMNAQTKNQLAMLFEQQYADLLKRQENDQKRMQQEFLRQQQELLQKMQILMSNQNHAEIIANGSSSSIIGESTRKSNEKMLIDDVNNQEPVVVDSNGNRVNRFTPENGKCIRRLSYDVHKLNLNGNNNSNNNNVNGCQLSPTNELSVDESDSFEMYTVEQVQAASIIVAHAKGYLVRRLMKTKKVLDLCKMHNDTLELLLDISEEDNTNESKSDVEFKYNLLQQVIHYSII